MCLQLTANQYIATGRGSSNISMCGSSSNSADGSSGLATDVPAGCGANVPEAIRSYVRYVVVLDPRDRQAYSVGIDFVLHTEGIEDVFAFLMRNVQRRHKKRVQSWLCESVVRGTECALGRRCPNVHVSRNGFAQRRLWHAAGAGDQGSTASESDETEVPTVAIHQHDHDHGSGYVLGVTTDFAAMCNNQTAVVECEQDDCDDREDPAEQAALQRGAVHWALRPYARPPTHTLRHLVVDSDTMSKAARCESHDDDDDSDDVDRAGSTGFIVACDLPRCEARAVTAVDSSRFPSGLVWADCDLAGEMDFTIPVERFLLMSHC